MRMTVTEQRSRGGGLFCKHSRVTRFRSRRRRSEGLHGEVNPGESRNLTNLSEGGAMIDTRTHLVIWLRWLDRTDQHCHHTGENELDDREGDQSLERKIRSRERETDRGGTERETDLNQ
jgi:hypothetical protein